MITTIFGFLKTKRKKTLNVFWTLHSERNGHRDQCLDMITGDVRQIVSLYTLL